MRCGYINPDIVNSATILSILIAMESISEQISDKSEPAVFEDIVYVALRVIKYECGREYQSDYYTVIPHKAVYLAEMTPLPRQQAGVIIISAKSSNLVPSRTGGTK